MFRLLTVVVCCLSAIAAAQPREPAAVSRHFAFFSDFDFNLHDALLAAGVERKFSREELFQSGDEKDCFASLAPSMQSGWNLAVDYYTAIISPHEFDDRQQFLLRLDLAGIGEPDDRERQFLDIAAGFRAAATPAYRACRWDDQQIGNRQWISSMLVMLEKHEAAIASRLASLYQESWPEQRLVVDVVQTVSWAGANSFFPRNHAGHLLIASGSESHEALETLFHEATHGFMLGSDPLQQALRDAASELGVDIPEGLWHVVQFVTTGETVRQVLAGAGEPGYVPMIVAIYRRSSWVQYRDAMDTVWPSYLDGTLGADEAMLALIRQAGDASGKEE